MVVCFCFNNLGALGLGAGLTSLIQHCSDSAKLHIYFLCSSVNNRIKAAIIELLSEAVFKGRFTFIDFNPYKEFKTFKSLQNDWTPYGRLLIPDLVNEAKVLYLDTDLLIETDVLEIFNIDLTGFALAAVDSTIVKYSLENIFYTQKLKLDPAIKTFNSGVLLLNVELWKTDSIKSALIKIGYLYPDELLAADQTLLNAFFRGNFFSLNEKYNTAWYAKSQPLTKTDAIFHFVGSPKPWDFFGKYLHTGYSEWKKYNADSWTKKVLSKNIYAQLNRAWTLKRSYLKHFYISDLNQ